MSYIRVLRKFMCQFANCQNIETPVKINMPGERVRFCCEAHAAAWLLNQAYRCNPMLEDAVGTLRLQVGDGS